MFIPRCEFVCETAQRSREERHDGSSMANDLVKALLANPKLLAMISTTMLTIIEISCVCCALGVWITFFGGWDTIKETFELGEASHSVDLERGLSVEERAERRALQMVPQGTDPTKAAVLKVIASRAVHEAMKEQEDQKTAMENGPGLFARLREWLASLFRRRPKVDPYEVENLKHV